MTEDKDSAPGTHQRFGWLRAASDRVPTGWFAGIATGLFLAATATFGGLATAPGPEINALKPGQEHRNSQLSITIERAVLVDELPDAGVFVEDGERVLALLVTLENKWTEPLAASTKSSIPESVQITELADTAPDSIARYDDGTLSPWLQPGIPTPLVLAWAIEADLLHDAQELTITLNDMTLYTGSFVANGQWWTDPVPAATVSLVLEDIGSGG